MMELEKLLSSGVSATINIKFLIQVERLNQRMSHCNSSWFHGMIFIVVKISYLLIIEICNSIIGHEKIKFIELSLMKIL